MAWKSYFFQRFLEDRKGTPYEILSNGTNFLNFLENGELFLNIIFCNLFHTKS